MAKNKKPNKKANNKDKSSFIKNLGRSIGNTGIDVAGSIMPNLTSAVKSNAKFVKSKYETVKDTVSETDIKDSFLYKSGRDLIRNAISDIKTGNINNKKRQKENSADPFGLDKLLDFDMSSTEDTIDDAFNFGSDLERDNLEEARDKNSDMNLNSYNLNLDMDDDTKSDIKTMANFSQASTRISNMGFATLNKQLNTLVQFQNDNTLKFYQTVEERLTELENHLNISSAYYKDLVANNEKVENQPDKISLETAYGMNGFRLEDWIDVYSEKIQEMKDAFEGVGNLMLKPLITDFVNNPLGTLLKQFGKRLVPEGIKNSLNDFDKSFKTLPIMLQSKIPSLREKGGIFSFFADILDLNKNRVKNQRNEFAKGPIPFDGITKRSITHVIPGYLRRILFALTGNERDNLVYDMNRGRFVTESDSKEEYKERIENAPREAIDNNIDILESNYIKALKDNNIIQDDSEADKYIDDLRTSLAMLGKSGKTLSSDLDISDLSQTLHDKESATILMDVIDNLNTRGLNEANQAMADAYLNYQSVLRDSVNEDRWSSTYDLGSIGKLEKKKDINFMDTIDKKYDEISKIRDDTRRRKYEDTIFEGAFDTNEEGRNIHIEKFLDKYYYSKLKGTITDSGSLDEKNLKKKEKNIKKGKKIADKMDPNNIKGTIDKNSQALQILQLLGMGNIGSNVLGNILKIINKDGDPKTVEATINRVINDVTGRRKGILGKNDLSLYTSLTEEGNAIRVKVVGGSVETIEGATPEAVAKRNYELNKKLEYFDKDKNEKDKNTDTISEDLKEIKDVLKDSSEEEKNKNKENDKKEEKENKEKEEEKKNKEDDNTKEEKEKSKIRKMAETVFKDYTGNDFNKENIEDMIDDWLDTNFGRTKTGQLILKYTKTGLTKFAEGKLGQSIIGKNGFFGKLFNSGDNLVSSLVNRAKDGGGFIKEKGKKILEGVSKRTGVNGKFIANKGMDLLDRAGNAASNFIDNTAKVINKEMPLREGLHKLWKGTKGTVKSGLKGTKGGIKRAVNLVRNKDIRTEEEKERDNVVEEVNKKYEYKPTRSIDYNEFKNIKPEDIKNVNIPEESKKDTTGLRRNSVKDGLFKVNEEYVNENSRKIFNPKFRKNIRKNLTRPVINKKTEKEIDPNLVNRKDDNIPDSINNVAESIERSVNKLNDNLTDTLKSKIDDINRTSERSILETQNTLENQMHYFTKNLDGELRDITEKLRTANEETIELKENLEELIENNSNSLFGNSGDKDNESLVEKIFDKDGDGSAWDDAISDLIDGFRGKKSKTGKVTKTKKGGIFKKVKNKIFKKGKSEVGDIVEDVVEDKVSDGLGDLAKKAGSELLEDGAGTLAKKAVGEVGETVTEKATGGILKKVGGKILSSKLGNKLTGSKLGGKIISKLVGKKGTSSIGSKLIGKLVGKETAKSVGGKIIENTVGKNLTKSIGSELLETGVESLGKKAVGEAGETIAKKAGSGILKKIGGKVASSKLGGKILGKVAGKTVGKGIVKSAGSKILGKVAGSSLGKVAGSALGKVAGKAAATKIGGALIGKLGLGSLLGAGSTAAAGTAAAGTTAAATAGTAAAGTAAAAGGLTLGSVLLPALAVAAGGYGLYKLFKKTPKKDKNGNIIYDENGNPVMERGYQKAGRWIKNKWNKLFGKKKDKNKNIDNTEEENNVIPEVENNNNLYQNINNDVTYNKDQSDLLKNVVSSSMTNTTANNINDNINNYNNEEKPSNIIKNVVSDSSSSSNLTSNSETKDTTLNVNKKSNNEKDDNKTKKSKKGKSVLKKSLSFLANPLSMAGITLKGASSLFNAAKKSFTKTEEVKKDENGNVIYDNNGKPLKTEKEGFMYGTIKEIFGSPSKQKEEEIKKENENINTSYKSANINRGTLLGSISSILSKNTKEANKEELTNIKNDSETKKDSNITEKEFTNSSIGMYYKKNKEDELKENKLGESSNNPMVRAASFLSPIGKWFTSGIFKKIFGNRGMFSNLIKGLKKTGKSALDFIKKLFGMDDEESNSGTTSASTGGSGWSTVFDFVGKEESGNDPGKISSGVGDAGGKSYGAYQFSSTMGSADRFANWLKNQSDSEAKSWGDRLTKYSAGTNGFDTEWTAIAKENPTKFLEYQQKKMIEDYYNPAIANIKKINSAFDPNKYTVALNSLIMSTATQYGPAASIWRKVFSGQYDMNNEADLIRGFKETRIATFPTTTARYEREYTAAMELYNKYKGTTFESMNNNSSNNNGSSSGRNTLGDRAVASAKKLIGKPYIFGGNYPPLGGNTGTDCSGLMQWAYNDAGKKISRTTYTQINEGTAVPIEGAQGLKNARPGDLLFPNTGHVYMYAGNGEIIEAAKEGIPIRKTKMYDSKLIAIRRITSQGADNIKGQASSNKKGVTAPNGQYLPNGVSYEEYLKIGTGESKYSAKPKLKNSTKKDSKTCDNPSKPCIIKEQGFKGPRTIQDIPIPELRKQKITSQGDNSIKELSNIVTKALKEINNYNKISNNTTESNTINNNATYISKNNTYMDETRNKLILKLKDIMDGIYENTSETNNILLKILEALSNDKNTNINNLISNNNNDGLTLNYDLNNLFKGL